MEVGLYAATIDINSLNLKKKSMEKWLLAMDFRDFALTHAMSENQPPLRLLRKLARIASQTLFNAMILLPPVSLVDMTMRELYLKTLSLQKGGLISSEILYRNMVSFRLISEALMRRNSRWG